MSKLSDIIKQALDKKNGVHYHDNSDIPTTAVKKKVKKTPPIGKKPPTRSAGRGR